MNDVKRPGPEDSGVLTPELLQQGIKRLREQSMEPERFEKPTVIVSPRMGALITAIAKDNEAPWHDFELLEAMEKQSCIVKDCPLPNTTISEIFNAKAFMAWYFFQDLSKKDRDYFVQLLSGTGLT